MSAPRLRVATAAALLGALVASLAGNAIAADFTFNPPGKLEQKEVYGFYGNGYTDTKVFAPGLRFPIETGPAYANSQIYGIGGNGWDGNKPKQSSAGWKDPANYSYPWWDNYCEIRSWDMPFCPSGNGHQGQDIRPADSTLDKHWVVAVADGTITNAYESASDYLVELTAADGTLYQYLHMSSVTVVDGQKVKKGDRVGKVSNKFYSGGASVPTTTHLHWQAMRNGVYIPVYTSLLSAYGTLLGVPVALGSQYAAKFVSQSWAYSSAPPIELVQGQAQTGFLELENVGTETWKAGVVLLAPTPRDKPSVFAAPSWVSPTRVSTVDKDVAPGESFKFPLALAGNIVAGAQSQTFGLVVEGKGWFSDDAPLGGGPPDNQLEVKALVKAAPPGSGGSGGSGGSAASSGSGGAPGGAAGAGGQGGNEGGGASSGGAGGKANAGGGAGKPAGSAGKGGSEKPSGPSAGAAGTENTGKAGSAAKPDVRASNAEPATEADGCGCRVVGEPTAPWAPLTLVAAGLAVFSARRRRSFLAVAAARRKTKAPTHLAPGLSFVWRLSTLG